MKKYVLISEEETINIFIDDIRFEFIIINDKIYFIGLTRTNSRSFELPCSECRLLNYCTRDLFPYGIQDEDGIAKGTLICSLIDELLGDRNYQNYQGYASKFPVRNKDISLFMSEYLKRSITVS